MQLSLEDANKFVLDFVSEFRKKTFSRHRPSTRQAISMSSLLSTIYFKRGYLTIDDLIKVAVITTPPPYQEEALRVALKVTSKSKEEKHVASQPLPALPTLAFPLSIILPMLLSLPAMVHKFMRKVWSKVSSLNETLNTTLSIRKGATTFNEKAHMTRGRLASTLRNARASGTTTRLYYEHKRVTKCIKDHGTTAYSGKSLSFKRGAALSTKLTDRMRDSKSLVDSLKHKVMAKVRMSKRKLSRELKVKGAYRMSDAPSLNAGPGENLLREWYELKHYLPAKVRRELKEIVRETLIEYINVYTKLLTGTNKIGVLPSHAVKPCESPDLLEYVDLEETIENLLSKCKRLTEITYDDLMMRVPERGNNAIVLLLDASGSMSGEKLVIMTISAAIMLRMFSEDEVAFAIFESDVFRVKDIDERVDLNEVIDELLELESLGGTCVSRALLWAEEQFERSTSDTRILVLLSDLAFYDVGEAEYVLNRMISNNIKGFAIVPRLSYNIMMASSIERLGVTIIEVNDWKDAVSYLCSYISSSYYG